LMHMLYRNAGLASRRLTTSCPTWRISWKR
jgi:hypothetical protein